jgi:multiple sugar transport system substrate-binding protein
MAAVFATYRQLFDEGVAASGSKDEAGPTWPGAPQGGKIGIAPGPSAWLGLIEEKSTFKLGVAPISGPDGGESTFVGGDAVGIGATGKHAAQAWDFISWTLGDDATYNDPQSPWVTAFRGALFGDNAQKALDDGATALTAALQK